MSKDLNVAKREELLRFILNAQANDSALWSDASADYIRKELRVLHAAIDTYIYGNDYKIDELFLSKWFEVHERKITDKTET